MAVDLPSLKDRMIVGGSAFVVVIKNQSNFLGNAICFSFIFGHSILYGISDV